MKADFLNTPVTTLANALATTGPVEVHTGELALGANHRIPDSAPLMVKPGGTFNTATFTETVGKLIMNGGVLKGSGTLTASSIEWWGGILTAPVSSSGNFVKKGGADWSRPANLTYSGDTVIESGKLAFPPGGPALPGTGRVVLANGTGIDLNGTSASIARLDVTGNATLTGGTLAVTQSLTGSGTLTNSGNLDLSAVTTISPTVSLSSTGTLVLPAGAWSVKRLILNGVIQRAGVTVDAASHPGLVTGAGTITALEDIPVPTGLSATATLGQIALTWNAIPGVTSYVVRRSTTRRRPVFRHRHAHGRRLHRHAGDRWRHLLLRRRRPRCLRRQRELHRGLRHRHRPLVFRSQRHDRRLGRQRRRLHLGLGQLDQNPRRHRGDRGLRPRCATSNSPPPIPARPCPIPSPSARPSAGPPTASARCGSRKATSPSPARRGISTGPSRPSSPPMPGPPSASPRPARSPST